MTVASNYRKRASRLRGSSQSDCLYATVSIIGDGRYSDGTAQQGEAGYIDFRGAV